jgi:hypothetical protein
MTDGKCQLLVSEVGYKLSMLRVAPGKEVDVARQLSAAIEMHTGKEPVRILKLFGRFDLCAIYRTTDFEPGPSKGGPIAGIRGSNKILAFNWATGSQAKGLAVEQGKGRVWGISFFRFNESLLEQDGARIETALASHWLNSPIPGVTMSVLGSIGWAEVVLVLRSEKFASIAKALDTISKQKVYVLEGTRARIELVPAKTLSIFGIDYELLSSAERIRSLPASLPEPFARNKGVFPKLAITCPAASMHKVREYGEKYFGPAVIAFGVHDLVFVPESGTWGNLTRRVLMMRRYLSQHIYSTSIGVFQEPPKETDDRLTAGSHQVHNAKRLQHGAVPFPRKLPHLLKRSGADLEGRLTNLYFGLINLMHDPVIGTCFTDLRPFATKRLPLLLEKFTPGDEYWQNLLDSVVDVFQYGVEERTHGAFLSLEQLEASLSPAKAGIQRVLSAASLIPRTLFSRIHRPWQGFLVAGYYNELFSSHYDIINLPLKYLFHPQEWIGLFHETGHVAFFDTNFFNMDDVNITTALKRGLHSAPEEEYELWRELVFEVGADLFDLYFCYGEDFDSYFLNIWPFLIHATGSLRQQYFVRNFIAYEYCKHFISANCTRLPSALALREEVTNYRQKLDSLKLLQDVAGRNQRQADDAAIFGLEVMAPIIEVYHQLFRQQGPKKDLTKELTSSSLRKQVDMVMNGGVTTKRIVSPDSFLLALKRRQTALGGELPLSVRLATILSLWHTAVTHSPE